MISFSETSEVSRTSILPDILAKWPWSRTLSEHYDEAKAESFAWVESFKPFDDEGLRRFKECDQNLLASLAYSPREKPIIRLGCDLMHLFSVYDEYTDVEDGTGAQELYDVAADTFANPDKPRPDGEVCVGRIAQDFWVRLRALVKPDATCLSHFLSGWDAYTAAVIQEADDRTNAKYRTFDDYLRIRRDTIGVYPALALVEIGLDLPEDVYYHPVLIALRQKATDLIIIINDVCSFAMEQSRGLSVHNGVEIVRHERKLTLQEAMDWLGRYGEAIVASFLADIINLPSCGPEIDRNVRVYIDRLGQFVRGTDDWTFESPRYFGPKGPTIKKSRLMPLLPPGVGSCRPHKSPRQD